MPTWLPDGTHRVRCTGAYITESRAKGTPGIVFNFRNERGIARKESWITAKTAEYVCKDLETLGVPASALDSPETLDRLNELVMDAEVDVVVEGEEYQGDMRFKVRWINEVRSEVGGDVVSRVYGLLTGREAPVAIKTQPAQPVLGEDEDLPF